MTSVIDWDDAFDNSGYIDSAADYFGAWAANAEAARADLNGKIDIAYGNHEREKLDLFLPRNTPKGLVIFVHGGYWHLLDKSYFSHLAKGATCNGWAVALINYPLAPDVSITEITASVARGVEHAAQLVEGPIRLFGHSAGGHLVTRIICTDSALSSDVIKRIEKVVSVSGVHDLRPLLNSNMNDTLRLTHDEAASLSPSLNSPLKDIPVHFWVGAQERPEFLRQTRLIEEKWQRLGAQVIATFEADKHHFSVIESLELSESALTQELIG